MVLVEIASSDYFEGFALSLSFSLFIFPPLIPFVVHLSSRNLGCSFDQLNLSLALVS